MDNNKNVFYIIGAIIVSTLLQSFITKSSDIPEQLAKISTQIAYIQKELPDFATKEQLQSLKSDVNDIKVGLNDYALNRDLEVLDNRFKNEMTLNSIQHEKLNKLIEDE